MEVESNDLNITSLLSLLWLYFEILFNHKANFMNRHKQKFIFFSQTAAICTNRL